MQKENEIKELLSEAAADDRVRAIEDGVVSNGADLWVSHEDGSLYKQSSCSIHKLTIFLKTPTAMYVKEQRCFLLQLGKWLINLKQDKTPRTVS